MDSVSKALLLVSGESGPPQGQQAYTTPGTYSWVAPAGVTSVCVVCVGGGSYKSAAGLGWKNNIAVTPGTSYTLRVGNRSPSDYVSGQSSYFINESTVRGGGGNWNSNVGGTWTGDGGGNGGGSGGTLGAAGAGGYTGNGANATAAYNANGLAGSGGGGGSGALRNGGDYYFYGGGGGGVGILGQGANGTAGVYDNTGASNFATFGGGGGSGGGTGGTGTSSYSPGNGGSYGGAGAGAYDGPADVETMQPGQSGAVRIIWGAGRSFPSTNTGDV